MQTDPLISVDELAGLLDSAAAPRPVILDIRYPGVGSTEDGRAQYLAGHIPGAAHIDLDAALAAPHLAGVTGRHPLPESCVFEAAMRAAGVRADAPVIVYDDWLSIAAARAWWLLRWAGHADVRVLDGGWPAWAACGHPTATGEETPVPGDFTAEPGALSVVDAKGAADIAATGVLLDARPANRFRGEDETIDPVAGHIPGARSLPALSLIDEDGRFLPAHVLAQKFAQVVAGSSAQVGIYCGSGIQACHAALAAAVVGLAEPSVYVGSWSDWITDPTRPVETGEGASAPRIEELAEADAEDAADLWRACGLTMPCNDPVSDFMRALTGPSSTVLGIRGADLDGRDGLVGTVMVGSEGHRGWMYYVAVRPDLQGHGLGTALVRAAEAWLAGRGTPKAMLMVRAMNEAAQGFYHSLDYETSTVTVMQRWL